MHGDVDGKHINIATRANVMKWHADKRNCRFFYNERINDRRRLEENDEIQERTHAWTRTHLRVTSKLHVRTK